MQDVERAKTFDAEQVGLRIDHDVSPAAGVRVVQLTPSGSSCSIVLGPGLPGLSAEPGSMRGLHLVVDDIDAARRMLVDRGVDVDAVADLGSGIRTAGLADPDGNTWTLQQLPDPIDSAESRSIRDFWKMLELRVTSQTVGSATRSARSMGIAGDRRHLELHERDPARISRRHLAARCHFGSRAAPRGEVGVEARQHGRDRRRALQRSRHQRG